MAIGWRYLYHQENDDPSMRDREYTNRGMMACLADQIPVGVMRQTKLKPNPQYRILGLALVSGWDNGYFILESLSKSRQEVLNINSDNLTSSNIDVDFFADSRQKVLVEAVIRQGQPTFRRHLLDAYESRCAVTDCQVTQVLEAAHITRYYGPQSNILSNGLLLRSDIHGLFDQGLISIDTEMRVVIAQNLEDTIYGELKGKRLFLPKHENHRPSLSFLEQHRQWAGL